MYCWFTRKCAMKVWITFTHTTGYTYSAYPWHHTPHCLWPTLECGSFNQSIDKASCDAFPLCSALPNISGSHQSHHQAVAMQNYENILNNYKVRQKFQKMHLKKDFNFQKNLVQEHVESSKSTRWNDEVDTLSFGKDSSCVDIHKKVGSPASVLALLLNFWLLHYTRNQMKVLRQFRW